MNSMVVLIKGYYSFSSYKNYNEFYIKINLWNTTNLTKRCQGVKWDVQF